MKLRSKHQKTLQAIFDNPVRSDVDWKKIESLLSALGGEVSKGRGSRVGVVLNDVKAVFHRPHPEKETDKGGFEISPTIFVKKQASHHLNLNSHVGLQRI